MLCSVFFKLFCGDIFTSMMDYATSDWVCGAFEKITTIGVDALMSYCAGDELGWRDLKSRVNVRSGNKK